MSGEIQSRITTDTTLLQTVIGSSVSMALRNVLIFYRRHYLVIVTNPKLTGIVLLSVPLVIMPIILFGRHVRKLSPQQPGQSGDLWWLCRRVVKKYQKLSRLLITNSMNRDTFPNR